MVYGFTEGPRGAEPEGADGGAMTMSSGFPTGSSSCSISSVSSIGSRGGSDCSVAVRVGGSAGESPSAKVGKLKEVLVYAEQRDHPGEERTKVPEAPMVSSTTRSHPRRPAGSTHVDQNWNSRTTMKTTWQQKPV